jgi:hypothetical protein
MLAPQRLAYKTHLRKDVIPSSQGKRLSILQTPLDLSNSKEFLEFLLPICNLYWW